MAVHVGNPSSKEEAAETTPAASTLVSSTTHLRVVPDLETSAASATTGGIELASLGADAWPDEEGSVGEEEDEGEHKMKTRCGSNEPQTRD